MAAFSILPIYLCLKLVHMKLLLLMHSTPCLLSDAVDLALVCVFIGRQRSGFLSPLINFPSTHKAAVSGAVLPFQKGKKNLSQNFD